MVTTPTIRCTLAATALLLGFAAGLLPADSGTATSTRTATRPATTTTTASRPKPLDEKGVMDFLKEHEPDVFASAQLLKEKDPQKFAEILKRDLLKDVTTLLDLQKRDPALFAVTMDDRRLAFQALKLARQIRGGSLSPADLAARKAELHRLVTRQFEVRQQMRQLELAAQERRIEDLQKRLEVRKKDLQTREEKKAELIQAGVIDLLARDPKVEW